MIARIVEAFNQRNLVEIASIDEDNLAGSIISYVPCFSHMSREGGTPTGCHFKPL
jgi:hypothetical protein